MREANESAFLLLLPLQSFTSLTWKLSEVDLVIRILILVI